MAGRQIGYEARFSQIKDAQQLYDTLVEHCFSDFDESGNVRANDEVTRMPVLRGSSPRVLVDRGHDVTKTGIDLLARPRQPHRILAHLQSGSGYATGIRRFAGTKKDLSLEEKIDTRWDRRHVGRFGNQIAPVLD